MLFIEYLKPVHRGEIYLQDMVTGKMFIADFLAGQKKGVFDRIFRVLSEDADMEFLAIDGSVIKAHQHAAGAAKKNENEDEGLGRAIGGLSSEIHVLADGLGNPVDFILTGREVHDSPCADALFEGKKADFIVAGKAYDNNLIL